MTKDQERLLDAWKSLIKVPIIIEAGTVDSVDHDALTCVVIPLTDGPEIFDVRLKASIDDSPITDGLVQFPTVGSTVLVAKIGNDDSTRFIIAFSQVDSVQIYGGLNGGLINIQTLIEELNKTNDLVNAIVQSLTTWTPVPNDGGAALKVFATSELAGKVVGDFSDMEDTKTSH